MLVPRVGHQAVVLQDGAQGSGSLWAVRLVGESLLACPQGV